MFFFTKFLAFLPFGNFLRGTLGKLVMGAVLAFTLVAGFQFWLYKHDAAIKEAATIEFNIRQADELRRAQLEFDRRLSAVRADQEIRLAQLMAERDALEQEATDLLAKIQSGEFTGRTDESSDVLRETIRLLQQRAGG